MKTMLLPAALLMVLVSTAAMAQDATQDTTYGTNDSVATMPADNSGATDAQAPAADDTGAAQVAPDNGGDTGAPMPADDSGDMSGGE